MKPWRLITIIMPVTVSIPEVGPWSPPTAYGTRGAPGPPVYGWRGSDGVYHWEDGPAPARIGVLCDDQWRPYDASEIPDLIPTPGGFHRSQVKRQKRVYAAVAADAPSAPSPD